MLAARRGAAGLAAAAVAVLVFTAGPAPASIVAPPAPEEVESLFREACWQGLRDSAAFARGLQASSLSFRPIESAEPGQHFRGRASSVDYRRGAACTLTAHLRSLEAAEEIVRRISAFVALEAAASAAGDASTRSYRSAQLPASGGSVGVELFFNPPPPSRRHRVPYPPSFPLSISVYFTPDD